ncbi:hypothetical protein BDR03DRAFT_982971 [Suillus americanus]|nr:hypothetical protein BDR03DRAFT_982971 [Suillus americanus]
MPAFVMDRTVFAENCTRCTRMREDTWRHKVGETVDGTKLQLVSNIGRSSAVIVSTLVEAWGVVQGGLVADGTVKDMLYGLPVGLNKLENLSALHAETTRYGGTEYERAQEHPKKGSAFIKMNNHSQTWANRNTSRASFKVFMRRVFASSAIPLFGFYTYIGYSHGVEEAISYLTGEARLINNAAAMEDPESDNREINN